MIPEKAAPVTRPNYVEETTGPVPANSRQWTPLAHKCVTLLRLDWPDADWPHIWALSSRKMGGILWVSTRLSPRVENERASAGRDGQVLLGRTNSQARTGTGKKQIPCSAVHEQECQPYPVDTYSAVNSDLHTKGLKSSVDPKASCIQRTVQYATKWNPVNNSQMEVNIQWTLETLPALIYLEHCCTNNCDDIESLNATLFRK